MALPFARRTELRLEVTIAISACEDRLLSRGALDAAQSRRGFGQAQSGRLVL